MTLEFQPPFQINPYAQTPIERSLQNFNQTVGGIGDDWQKIAQQRKETERQNQLMAWKKQEADRSRQDWERENSGTLPLQGDQRTGSIDMTPQGTQSWNPSPLDMGRQPFAQPSTYSPSQSAPDQFSGPQTAQAMHAPGTDLSAHFNAWKQQGGGVYNHPEMSGQMSDANNPLAQWNQYAQIPGSRNRAEKMLFDKDQSALGLQASETAKNYANADYFSKRDPNKQPNTISSTSWQNATPQQQALAKALANEEIRPSDIGFKEKGVILSLAKEWADSQGIPFTSYGGDVKRGMAENMAYGKGGQNVISLNTALGHASDALKAYQDVKNVDAKFLNIPINKLMSQTNDPSIVALNLNLNALQGELETVFRNGGSSEKGIESWAKYLNNGLTPQQYYAAAQKINGLLKSRIGAQQHQYSNVMGNNISGRKLISPHSEELSQQLENAGQGSKQPRADGKIQVSKNGEDPRWIDPNDAAEAAKDGYQ